MATDYNSKYSGEQVEALLDQVASGNVGGGGITVEADPIFSASPAASITNAKKEEWDNKVDKVSGKGLSTEDFTSALKTKLEGLSNYDDTELSEAISTLRGDFDKLVSGDTTTAIKSFNEVIAFLDGISDTESLDSIIASIEQQIAGNEKAITETIPATYVKLEDVSTSADSETIVKRDNSNRIGIHGFEVSDEERAGVWDFHEHEDADYVFASQEDIQAAKSEVIGKDNDTATSDTVKGAKKYADSLAGNYATAAQGAKADSAYQKPAAGIPKSDLASAVQTSLGKADSAYQKASTGIPKADLASAVQTSLGKADSALQPAALEAYYTQSQVDAMFGFEVIS